MLMATKVVPVIIQEHINGESELNFDTDRPLLIKTPELDDHRPSMPTCDAMTVPTEYERNRDRRDSMAFS